jgi:hypothetical protein
MYRWFLRCFIIILGYLLLLHYIVYFIFIFMNCFVLVLLNFYLFICFLSNCLLGFVDQSLMAIVLNDSLLRRYLWKNHHLEVVVRWSIYLFIKDQLEHLEVRILLHI